MWSVPHPFKNFRSPKPLLTTRPPHTLTTSFDCHCLLSSRFAGIFPRPSSQPGSPKQWRDRSASRGSVHPQTSPLFPDSVYRAPTLCLHWPGALHMPAHATFPAPGGPGPRMFTLRRENKGLARLQ